MNFKAMQKRKGFTMMELLVVVVVLAILAAIGMNYFGGAQDDTKITSAKDEMKTIAGAAAAYSTILKTAPTGKTTGGELLTNITAVQAGDNREHQRLLADGRWNTNESGVRTTILLAYGGENYNIDYAARTVTCVVRKADGKSETLTQKF